MAVSCRHGWISKSGARSRATLAVRVRALISPMPEQNVSRSMPLQAMAAAFSSWINFSNAL